MYLFVDLFPYISPRLLQAEWVALNYVPFAERSLEVVVDLYHKTACHKAVITEKVLESIIKVIMFIYAQITSQSLVTVLVFTTVWPAKCRILCVIVFVDPEDAIRTEVRMSCRKHVEAFGFLSAQSSIYRPSSCPATCILRQI